MKPDFCYCSDYNPKCEFCKEQEINRNENLKNETK